MEKNNLAAFEAVLFAAGEPLEMEKIAEAMQIDFDEVYSLFEQLCKIYDDRSSGLCVLKLDNKLQLCTRRDYYNEVRAVLEIRRNTPLSQAAFEVLAVIAYNQPVTKSFVEQVRGVDCSGVVGSLCEKGLIEEKGRLDLPGRPLLYGTTDAFLRCFSMKSLSDLPPVPHEKDESEADDENSQDETQLSDVDETQISNEAKDIEVSSELPENEQDNEPNNDKNGEPEPENDVTAD